MLKNNELLEIKGGISWTAVGIGGAVVSFLIGLFDGYVRPLRCRS